MKRRTIGHYEFIRKIGTGGSGVVYLATDTLLQRPVVLKLLKRGSPHARAGPHHATPRSPPRLRHRPPKRLRHLRGRRSPTTKPTSSCSTSPASSLDKVIAAGPSSLQVLLSIGIQISDGLSAAHQLGIFHRDLKPANVMLTEGGLVKILDFGLARRFRMDEADFDPSMPGKPPQIPSRATYTARGGTIAYMAPEQFVTGQSSVQSDIFALGLILYELATGRHPFHRPDAPDFQSIRAIQYADPPPLKRLGPNPPPGARVRHSALPREAAVRPVLLRSPTSARYSGPSSRPCG